MVNASLIKTMNPKHGNSGAGMVLPLIDATKLTLIGGGDQQSANVSP